MWKSVKQEFVVQRNLFFWIAGISVIAWIFGMAVMMIAETVAKGTDESYFCLGTVLILIVGVIMSIFMGGLVIYQGFDDAIHMGKTRKRFLPAVALVIFLAALLPLVLAVISVRVEYGIYAMVFPHLPRETGPEAFLTPGWILCFACGITGLACAYGGIVKANRKGGGIFCLTVWLILCWSVGGIGESWDGKGVMGIFHWIGNTVSTWYISLPVWMRMGTLVLIGVCGYTLMYGLLWKKATD